MFRSAASSARAWASTRIRTSALCALFVLLASLGVGFAHAEAGGCDAATGPAAAECHIHEQPFDLRVAYLVDCDGASLPPACGNPPARWPTVARPVAICSFSANHPAWLTEAQFRQAVADAASTWNRVDAAIGIRYVGDCTRGNRWVTDDGFNQVGFDDAREALTGSAVGVTRAITDWSPQWSPTSRTIIEADIVLDADFANEPACFATAVTHEMGHVLGFGHSDSKADLMYPSYDAQNPASCLTGPSSVEEALLKELYGVDRAPVVTVSAPAIVRGGTPVTVTATGTDPEGQPLTYSWTQVGGPPAALVPSGANVSFSAPNAPGVVRLRVTATDVFLHPGTADASITISSGAAGTGRITGALPSTGFGLVVFSGGTEQQLLSATMCPASTAAFWASDGRGGFLAYVPGTTIAAVNAPWFADFALGIPTDTPLIGRCST